MKRIDFENGSVTQNIFAAALPMLVAQILNLLYNIVDRIYIARIPHIGTAAENGYLKKMYLLTYLEVAELLYFRSAEGKREINRLSIS